MAKPVGKLKKINLKEVWSNEVDGFASWLQQEEILEMLGEARCWLKMRSVAIMSLCWAIWTV